MKNFKASIMISILAIVSVASSLYFVIPGSIEAQSEAKTFVTHNGGIVRTTGEVLDPLYTSATMEFDPMEYLREFNYGRVSQLPNGTTLREFTIIAEDDKIMEISPGVFYNVWTFNGTVPGPTIRATEGDIVRVKFINNGSKSHTMHFHGIHPANMHGLYGVYIVDPKEPRPKADEMVMVLNGFDTDFDTENNFYAANTIPFYYQHNPIQINTDELIRVYVVNMVEFDPINNLHLHGNLYHYYPTGTDTVPSFYTDIITLSQTERGIMEFQYTYPGKYLFHAHKVEFSEKGWVGIFLVKENPANSIQGVKYGT